MMLLLLLCFIRGGDAIPISPQFKGTLGYKKGAFRGNGNMDIVFRYANFTIGNDQYFCPSFFRYDDFGIDQPLSIYGVVPPINLRFSGGSALSPAWEEIFNLGNPLIKTYVHVEDLFENATWEYNEETKEINGVIPMVIPELHGQLDDNFYHTTQLDKALMDVHGISTPWFKLPNVVIEQISLGQGDSDVDGEIQLTYQGVDYRFIRLFFTEYLKIWISKEEIPDENDSSVLRFMVFYKMENKKHKWVSRLQARQPIHLDDILPSGSSMRKVRICNDYVYSYDAKLAISQEEIDSFHK